MNGQTEELAHLSQADLENATSRGRGRPDVPWILSDRDVWYANPAYQGPPVPHPEDDLEPVEVTVSIGQKRFLWLVSRDDPLPDSVAGGVYVDGTVAYFTDRNGTEFACLGRAADTGDWMFVSCTRLKDGTRWHAYACCTPTQESLGIAGMKESVERETALRVAQELRLEGKQRAETSRPEIDSLDIDF